MLKTFTWLGKMFFNFESFLKIRQGWGRELGVSREVPKKNSVCLMFFQAGRVGEGGRGEGKWGGEGEGGR